MHVSIGLRTIELDSRFVRIDCPACKKHGVDAHVKDIRQTLLFFHFIPFFAHSPTTVKCQACGAELVSRLKTDDLARVGDSQFVARYLSIKVPLILCTLVLGGIIAWILPVIGTVWMGVAYWWSRSYSGWVRTLALILLILSLLPTIGLILGSVFSDTIEKRPNQALQHNDPSCHESCLRTPRASRGRG